MPRVVIRKNNYVMGELKKTHNSPVARRRDRGRLSRAVAGERRRADPRDRSPAMRSIHECNADPPSSGYPRTPLASIIETLTKPGLASRIRRVATDRKIGPGRVVNA